jgi:hypothetical protein
VTGEVLGNAEDAPSREEYDADTGEWYDDPGTYAHPDHFNRHARKRLPEYDQQVMCDARSGEAFCLRVGERHTFRAWDFGRDGSSDIHYLCADEDGCRARRGLEPLPEEDG